MRILLALEPGGVRLERLVTRSLAEEVAAGRLLAAIEKELSELDRAARAWAKSSLRGHVVPLRKPTTT